MLRLGLSTLGVGALLALILENSGGIGSCGPRPGMLPVLLAYMIALSMGSLVTLVGMVQLAIDRFRHREENRAMPHVIAM